MCIFQGEMEQDASVTCMCTTNDDTQVAIGTQDGTVTVWDLHSQSPVTQFQAHDGAVHCAKFTKGMV